MKKNIHPVNKKSYCGGIFCHKNDLKVKCVSCGIYVCNVCSVGNKCMDCYTQLCVHEFKNEFNEMIKELLKDDDKESITHIEKEKMKDVISV